MNTDNETINTIQIAVKNMEGLKAYAVPSLEQYVLFYEYIRSLTKDILIHT